MTVQTGKLYVVATPIGNLDDISYRACSILKQVDWIAAEDTRQSKKLLDHYQIRKKLVSLHSFNEKNRIDQVIEWIKSGQSGALISDAGTPCISDPGALLVQALHLNQISVVPIPGPCALIAALSVSGLASTGFLFVGFLSSKSAARRTKLSELKDLASTLVMYEAPHRIAEMLFDCKEILGGERKVIVARELTKKYETLYVNKLQNLFAGNILNEIEPRGEFVVVIEGALEDERQSQEVDEQKAKKILTKLLSELSVKSAVHLTSEITQCPKNKLYDWALTLQSQQTKDS